MTVRGGWKPTRLTATDVTSLLILLTTLSAVRGADYIYTAEERDALVLVEAAFPLCVWGGAFLTGAGVLIAGALLRRHFLVWLGHGWLWVLYLGLSVGLAVPYVTDYGSHGVRAATVLLAPAALHFILWLRTGPRPVSECETQPVETLARPKG